jgi:hypothetical protein
MDDLPSREEPAGEARIGMPPYFQDTATHVIIYEAEFWSVFWPCIIAIVVFSAIYSLSAFLVSFTKALREHIRLEEEARLEKETAPDAER